MSFGAGAVSGRGSDVSGRTETYYRRHDPAAPGPGSGTPLNEAPHAGLRDMAPGGGTQGLPTPTQAFKYHAWDKFTPGEKFMRGLIGLIMPGGTLLQGAIAGSQAARDVAGAPGSFDFEPARKGEGPLPLDYDSSTPVQIKKTAGAVSAKPAQAASAPPKGVTPASAVAARGVSGTTPSRQRAGGTQVATILSSPFGDLSGAPVTKKLLLGA